ncbi:hypothetical protein [Undibacterium umbellatum]|uniref:hypothetical protein n=1 Tax=Undibacterium umbellatum TaxID=2762300 RepID=UPI00164C926C
MVGNVARQLYGLLPHGRAECLADFCDQFCDRKLLHVSGGVVNGDLFEAADQVRSALQVALQDQAGFPGVGHVFFQGAALQAFGIGGGKVAGALCQPIHPLRLRFYQ